MKTADMHCDTIGCLMARNSKEKLMKNKFHIDIARLMQADYTLQCFAMFVDLHRHEKPYEYCNKMIDKFYEQMAECSEFIAPVTSAAQIDENMRAGKLSALLTVEEGGVCEGDISKLRALYDRGVRLLTLSWNYQNELGCGNRTDELGNIKEDEHIANTVSGLTDKGVEFVEEMERLGMIIDVSHLSDAGFYDVARVTKKPFVASHSNARAVCGHCRNLTDDMIRIIAQRGGVIGLNLCPSFIADITREQYDAGEGIIRMEDMIKHIKHIINVGGSECIGLGTDFDGIRTNAVLPDCSYMPRLAQALEVSGISNNVIENLFYKNVTRLLHQLL